MIPPESLGYPELEGVIDADPDAIEPRLVLADAMQQAGDPRGELILLQHLGTRGRKALLKEAEARIEADPARYLGDMAGDSRIELDWRLGFIHAARLLEWDDDPTRLRYLLASPSARFLARLEIVAADPRAWRGMPRCTAALGERSLPALRSLSLGRCRAAASLDLDPPYNHLVPLGDLTPALEAAPGLRRLSLRTPEGAFRFGLVPGLRDLHFETFRPPPAIFDWIQSGRWPALASLSLTFQEASVAESKTIEEWLARTPSSPIVRLALDLPVRRSRQILAALLESPLLPRLSSLDLSGGRISWDAARSLYDRRSALAHLQELKMDSLGLPPEQLREMRAALPNLKISG